MRAALCLALICFALPSLAQDAEASLPGYMSQEGLFGWSKKSVLTTAYGRPEAALRRQAAEEERQRAHVEEPEKPSSGLEFGGSIFIGLAVTLPSKDAN